MMVCTMKSLMSLFFLILLNAVQILSVQRQLRNNDLVSLFRGIQGQNRSLQQQHDDDSHLTEQDHFHIEMIDVKCADSQSGMIVTIHFADEFNGIIYSQGYFNDPKCRYVPPSSKNHHFTFTVPFDGCGSKQSCSICTSIDNILVIQSDEEVQELWDMARKVSCTRTLENEETIIFKPFVVDMLEAVNVETSSGPVQCWMDIMIGKFPQITPIERVIKIGEPLTILVYLKDPQKKYDINVKDCYAFDHEDFQARSTKKLQLSDRRGCPKKSKLFKMWEKTTETGATGATLLTHNTLYAFKFPDKMQVFLKCDIEICRGQCGEVVCDSDVTTPRLPPSSTFSDASISTRKSHVGETSITPLRCYPDSKDPECFTKDLILTTSRCYPGSRNPACRQAPESTTTYHPFADKISVGSRSTVGPPNIQSEKPLLNSPTNVPLDSEATTLSSTDVRCHPESRDPQCLIQRIPDYTSTTVYFPTFSSLNMKKVADSDYSSSSFSCQPSSNDPHCLIAKVTTSEPQLSSSYTTLASGILERQCYLGSKNPLCSRSSTIKPSLCYPGSMDSKCQIMEPGFKKQCFHGSTDPKCHEGSTNRVSLSQADRVSQCYPGSSNPLCYQLPNKPSLNCFPGSSNPECRKESSTPSKCYPGTRNPECTSEISKPPIKCYPGSPDPECNEILEFTPSSSALYTVPTATTYLSSQTIAPTGCYPGSTDPECKKERTSQTSQCYPGTTDLQCRTTKKYPQCHFGSIDPSCKQETTERSQKCYPGSQDFKCRGMTTEKAPECYSGSQDPKCQQVTTEKAPQCYPGSKDLRCQEETAKKTSQCYPGSTDPLCQSGITERIQQCYPGSADAKCQKPTTIRTVGFTPIRQTTRIPATYLPPDTTIAYRCYPGAKDVRCGSSTTASPYTTVRILQCYPASTDPGCRGTSTEKIHPCYPGSTDPRCHSSTTEKNTQCYPGSLDPGCRTSSMTNPPRCYPRSEDSRCKKKTSEKSRTSQPGPTNGIVPVPTTRLPLENRTTVTNCSLGSNDPRCRNIADRKPFACYRDLLDPKCQKVTKPETQEYSTLRPTTRIPATYLPPNTATQSSCYLGAEDPRCKNSITESSLKCESDRPDPRCLKTTPDEFLRCHPGSTDLRCLKVIKEKPSIPPYCNPKSSDSGCQEGGIERTTTRMRYIPENIKTTVLAFKTTTKPILRCHPKSTDATCFERMTERVPECHLGSTDLKCRKIITAIVPQCYPGSIDLRCQKITTEGVPLCSPRSTDPRCQKPTTRSSFKCFPGSIDTRCQTSTTERPSQCYAASADPKCRTPAKERPIQPQQCYLGSTDPRCQKSSATIPPTTYISPDTKFTIPGYGTTAEPNLHCHPGSTDPACHKGTTEIVAECYPGATQTECRKTTTKPTGRCYPGSSDPRCKKNATERAPHCYPGSTDPRCVELATENASQCYSGSLDPKCQRYKAESVPQCAPGSTDSRCQINTTERAIHCYQGSPDRRCLTGVTERLSSTTRAPTTYLPLDTLSTFRCNSNSKDPRCNNFTKKTSTKPVAGCHPNSNDPLCRSGYNLVTTTQLPPTTFTPIETSTTSRTCYPGSTSSTCVNTTAKPQLQATSSLRCYSGSTDLRCQKVDIQTSSPDCFPGSTDLRCPQITPGGSPKCGPTSTDPRCPEPFIPTFTTSPNIRKCYSGSLDPACKDATAYVDHTTRSSTIPQTDRYTTTQPIQCQPGSRDPRCPSPFVATPITTQPSRSRQSTLDCNQGSNDPRCLVPISTTENPLCYLGSEAAGCPQSHTTPNYCFPGSKDSRCPWRPQSSRVPATYLPPLADPGSDRTIYLSRQSDHITPKKIMAKASISDDINQLAVKSTSSVYAVEVLKTNGERLKRDLTSAVLLTHALSEPREVISITLNVKGFDFSPLA